MKNTHIFIVKQIVNIQNWIFTITCLKLNQIVLPICYLNYKDYSRINFKELYDIEERKKAIFRFYHSKTCVISLKMKLWFSSLLIRFSKILAINSTPPKKLKTWTKSAWTGLFKNLTIFYFMQLLIKGMAGFVYIIHLYWVTLYYQEKDKSVY